MSSAVADNDILFKGAWFGLLLELIGVIPSAPERTFVLGQARFVVGKRLERQHKNAIPGASEARVRFTQAIETLTTIEPSNEEQLLAAELENAAQRTGLPLDAGESLLCAVVIRRGLDKFVTGDKRAVAALETLIEQHSEVVVVSGRLECLEQLFLRLLAAIDLHTVRNAVCQCAHVDRALAICFRCATSIAGIEEPIEGLASFVNSLRVVAPRMLAR